MVAKFVFIGAAITPVDVETTTMIKLSLNSLDRNLANDIAGEPTDGYSIYEIEYANATVSNQHWQVLWHEAYKRAGVVFCGSGSSGQTHWTDASCPEDAVRRVVMDEIAN